MSQITITVMKIIQIIVLSNLIVHAINNMQIYV